MGILKDHSVVKILKNKTLRNDPDVIRAVCSVITHLDEDMDKVGELVVGSKLDHALEELNSAVEQAENPAEEDDEDEEEDEEEDNPFDFNDEDDDDDDDEEEDTKFVDEDDDDDLRG